MYIVRVYLCQWVFETPVGVTSSWQLAGLTQWETEEGRGGKREEGNREEEEKQMDPQHPLHNLCYTVLLR